MDCLPQRRMRVPAALPAILIFVVMVTSLTAAVGVRTHDIRVYLDPGSRMMSAGDTMLLTGSPDGNLRLLVNRSFSIDEVSLNGQALEWRLDPDFTLLYARLGPNLLDQARATATILDVTLPTRLPSGARLSVRYRAELPPPPLTDTGTDRLRAAAWAGDEGAFLGPEGFWYPRPDDDPAAYSVTVTAPVGYQFVTGGVLTGDTPAGDGHLVTWRTAHPAEPLALVGGRFSLKRASWKGLDLLSYFPASDDAGVAALMQAVRDSLQRDIDLFGAYPFKKFALVQGIQPVTRSFASFVVLGQDRLRATSAPLSVDILRNWWGHGVRVDRSGGDWSLGLAICLGELYPLEQQDSAAAAERRRRLLSEYADYVREHTDMALKDVADDHGPAGRVLGGGKGAMVWHMLRLQVGDDAFFEALKRIYADDLWKTVSWRGLIDRFQAVSEELHEKEIKEKEADGVRVLTSEREKDLSLDWFYQQWITRPGAATLAVKIRSLFHPLENQFLLSFVLSQAGPVYRLYVPVRIETTKTPQRRWMTLEESSREFQLVIPDEPQFLQVDPDAHVFRQLWHQENGLTIARVWETPELEVVLPANPDRAEAVKDTLTNRLVHTDIRFLPPSALPRYGEDWVSVIEPWQTEEPRWRRILADRAPVVSGIMTLDGRTVALAGHTVVLALPAFREGEGLGVVVISDAAPPELAAILAKVNATTSEGYLVFKGTDQVRSGRWPGATSPLRVKIE